MLQRQAWHLRKQQSHLPLCLIHSLRHPCRTIDASNRSRPRHSTCSTLTDTTSLDVPRASSSLRNTRLVVRSHPLHTRGAIDKSWIKPESLSESLDAHRRANRDGSARDGTPVKTSRRDNKSKKKGRQPQQGPWVGMSVVRLAGTSAAKGANTEYGGLCPPLLSEWQCDDALQARLRFPWMSRLARQADGACIRTAREQLSTEIQACEEYFSPSPSERRAATRAFLQIRDLTVQSLGLHNSVDLVGSRAAGNEGPVSDIDINVKIGDDGEDVNHLILARTRLYKIHTHMRMKQHAGLVLPHAYIRTAHVPIIVGTHVPSGLEFQIQTTFSAYDSLEVSRAFVAEFPAARTLFKILKQMLTMRGLDKGVLGGVTSYPLLNMIVVSQKLAQADTDAQDLPSHLFNFLDFWSEFDFEKHKVVFTAPNTGGNASVQTAHAVDPISSLPRVVAKATASTDKAFMMSLQDPADTTNDLGRNTHAIRHVQACFIAARASIRRNMQAWSPGLTVDGTQQDRLPILAWCLGGDYTSFEEARWHLHRYDHLKMTGHTSI